MQPIQDKPNLKRLPKTMIFPVSIITTNVAESKQPDSQCCLSVFYLRNARLIKRDSSSSWRASSMLNQT